MPAELEEIVPHSDGAHRQHLFPYLSQPNFQVVPRRDECFLQLGAKIARRWKRAAVNFAVG